MWKYILILFCLMTISCAMPYEELKKFEGKDAWISTYQDGYRVHVNSVKENVTYATSSGGIVSYVYRVMTFENDKILMIATI